MRANCTRHLQAAIGTCSPRWSSRGARDSLKRCGVRSASPNDTDLGTNLARCDLDGNQFIWAALRHPTRNWSSINQPYFRDTVVPTLRQARKRALKFVQTV